MEISIEVSQEIKNITTLLYHSWAHIPKNVNQHPKEIAAWPFL
jgi:hypothetical protein